MLKYYREFTITEDDKLKNFDVESSILLFARAVASFPKRHLFKGSFLCYPSEQNPFVILLSAFLHKLRATGAGVS